MKPTIQSRPFHFHVGLAFSVLTATIAPCTHADTPDAGSLLTTTPIKHLIVVVGENHSFDNLFAAYLPPPGQTVHNLLSQGIILPDGSPGPRYSRAIQQQASNTGAYRTAPDITGPYAVLPQPHTTYATGQPQATADERFPADLPPGPFQITRYAAYNAYLGDPVHRFFQMWQQHHHGANDLVAWVGVTAGIGPDNMTAPKSFHPGSTLQGGEAMGFYNMQAGDAPGFQALAQRYAISDNYHQSVMGGTGANFLALATGDVAFFNLNGKPARPTANQIENPDARPGTNNWYRRDGYTGGSYVNCADLFQPGVRDIHTALTNLPGAPFRNGNCDPDTYYLVNNYDMGYAFNGKRMPLGARHYTLPPQTIPTIADALSAKQISWKWYSGGREAGKTTAEYCSICDPLTGFKSIMTSALKANLKGLKEFDRDLAAQLPAVAFVRPDENKAGHPANATTADFEAFVVDLVGKVKAQPEVWRETAILITVDEGGGYYDSGVIQLIDFFGDGPRIPLFVVSPWARRGHIDHTYADHASVLKFIEKNWGLAPLSQRSRDNLPNPVHTGAPDDYLPLNRPAIGDLTTLFDFTQAPQE
jgi:phospholipase C